MGTVTRLSDRRPVRTVTVQSQALAEAGIEVTDAGRLLADFLGQLAAANQGRPTLSRKLSQAAATSRSIVETGRWLCEMSAPTGKRAA